MNGRVEPKSRRVLVIKIRAERRCGELLRDMQKQHGARDGKQTELRDVTPLPPTLAELGIAKIQSSRWQKLAAVPDAQLERADTVARCSSATPGERGSAKLELK